MSEEKAMRTALMTGGCQCGAVRYAVGTEGMLAWLGELSRLPGKSTPESIGAAAAARVISNQHPDHDTGTEEA